MAGTDDIANAAHTTRGAFARRGLRARWAAVGATVAVLAGAGGVLTTWAASSGATAFVPIAPCRLLDTRAGLSNVGPRSTPIRADETFTTPARGANGRCDIPAGATGLSMNIVAIGPTAGSFLTVFPGGTDRPTASSLNWQAGQAPTPNGVTAKLGDDGSIAFYNLQGTVDIAVDVVGFYEPTAGGAAGPTGPAGPAGPQGPAGPAGPAGAAGVNATLGSNTVLVAKSGGDFTSLSAALAAITGTADAPYLVRVGPGIFDETNAITLEPHVTIEGSGRSATTLRSASVDGTLAGTGDLTGLELRNLAVVNTNASNSTGVSLGTASGTIRMVDLAVSSGNAFNTTRGILATGTSNLSVVDSTVRAGTGISSIAIQTQNGSLTVDGSTLSGNASLSVIGTGLTVRNSSLGGFPNTVIQFNTTAVYIASTLSSPISTAGTAPVCTGIIRDGVAQAGC